MISIPQKKHNNYSNISISIGTSLIRTQGAELDKVIFAKAWATKLQDLRV